MAPVHVAQLLAHPAVRAAITRALAARGVHGDTQLIHADPREEAMLRMMGGAGTINPRTGLRQFYPGQGGAGGGGVGPGDQGDTGGEAGSDPTGRGAGSGGYGRASDSRASSGSGAGYGGGHSGQNYQSQTYGGQAGSGGSGYQPSLAVAPAISNLPPPAPVTLTPMMSDTAMTNLIGSRFGALPSWATTPEQIGTAPSSYPTPGVNAGIGAPGYAGNPLPGQGGGGGSGGGGGALPTYASLGGSQNALQTAAGITGEGYQGTWQDAFNQATHNRLAQKFGRNTGPTSTMDLIRQWIGNVQSQQGAGQAAGQGVLSGAPPAGQSAQVTNQFQPLPGVLGGASAGMNVPALEAGGTSLMTPAQRLALLAATQRGTPGANRW